MNGRPHLVSSAGTQILGNDDASAHRRTLAERDQQIDQRCAGPYSRQGVTAHAVSDDNRVHRIISLLQQITQNQRNGK